MIYKSNPNERKDLRVGVGSLELGVVVVEEVTETRVLLLLVSSVEVDSVEVDSSLEVDSVVEEAGSLVVLGCSVPSNWNWGL
jgi:hypothetical protein